MPSIKEYNRKISSLKNTSKITKTMKMVSASKLRKAQEAQRNAAEFAHEVDKLIFRLGGKVSTSTHPLLRAGEKHGRILMVVFTSDKGLCGGFNNNLIKFAEREIARLEKAGAEVKVCTCGRRGYMYYEKRDRVLKNFPDITAKPDPMDAHRLSEDLQKRFLAGDFDRVYLVYNHFNSPISQTPKLKHFLPLRAEDFTFEGMDEVSEDFITEPDTEFLLNMLIPDILDFEVYYALQENSAGEHGARMTAMDNATSNAADMVDRYTLLRNRARQAAITTELIEIISGAEALT